ncbi:MAG: biotin carboxylase, partial [Rufibacter sp.]
LQVEHPVTEQITGLDLVKEQIKIAQGEPLSFSQEDLKISGHALELRVYAEDPANNFLPDIGTLTTYKRPQGLGVRVDDGFEEGMEIPIYYDPMIAKLVTFGKNRQEAIEKMLRAIDEYQITGIETTLPFGRFVMEHEAFRSGNFDTKFVPTYFTDPSVLKKEAGSEEEEIAAVLAAVFAGQAKQASVSEPAQATAPITGVSEWRRNRLK